MINPRKPSKNQSYILELLSKNESGTITKKECCEKIRYYHNTEHYVGQTLSSMVKQGMLIRIKPGIFKRGSMIKEADPKQQHLF